MNFVAPIPFFLCKVSGPAYGPAFRERSARVSSPWARSPKIGRMSFSFSFLGIFYSSFVVFTLINYLPSIILCFIFVCFNYFTLFLLVYFLIFVFFFFAYLFLDIPYLLISISPLTSHFLFCLFHYELWTVIRYRTNDVRLVKEPYRKVPWAHTKCIYQRLLFFYIINLCIFTIISIERKEIFYYCFMSLYIY